jgi:hypothetical protein
MNKRVYIAGPYTKGDVALNVRNAIEAGDRLYTLGYIPYIPHLTHYWHTIFPRPYEDWMQLDFNWVVVCDVLLRLPGESKGADEEVKLALENKIPVYYAIEQLVWGER